MVPGSRTRQSDERSCGLVARLFDVRVVDVRFAGNYVPLSEAGGNRSLARRLLLVGSLVHPPCLAGTAGLSGQQDPTSKGTPYSITVLRAGIG